MGIQKRKALNKQPKKKDGSLHQHPLSIQHEEPLRRRLLQEQLGRWMDDPKQRPEPIQGAPDHVQRGGNQGGRGRDQDGGEDQCLGVQARGAEGVCTVKTTSRRRKARGEERRRQCLFKRSFSRSYTLPKEAQADQMVSKLSSEGVLVITTPKSAPAITNEAPKEN